MLEGTIHDMKHGSKDAIAKERVRCKSEIETMCEQYSLEMQPLEDTVKDLKDDAEQGNEATKVRSDSKLK